MKFSVVVAIFNGENFLKSQLDSILKQKGNYFDQLILVDDNSTDNSNKILNEYKLTYPKLIHLIKCPYNVGVNKAFHAGILAAKNNHIVLSDQDDIWLKNKMEKIFNEFKFSSVDIIFGRSLILGTHVIYNHSKLREKNSLLYNKYRGASMAFNKTKLENCLVFSENGIYDKWIFFNVILNNLRYKEIKEPFDLYRLHPNNTVKKNHIFSVNKRKKTFCSRVRFYCDLKNTGIEKKCLIHDLILNFYSSIHEERTFDKLVFFYRLFINKKTSKRERFILIKELIYSYLF